MSKLKQMSARLAAVAGAFLVTVFFTSGFFGRAGAENKDFKAMAEETGMSYQNIINYYLLDCVREKRQLHIAFSK